MRQVGAALNLTATVQIFNMSASTVKAINATKHAPMFLTPFVRCDDHMAVYYSELIDDVEFSRVSDNAMSHECTCWMVGGQLRPHIFSCLIRYLANSFDIYVCRWFNCNAVPLRFQSVRC